MKKFVAGVFSTLLLLLCGCEQKPAPGNVPELMQYNWSAVLDGGGEVSLTFEGERAELTMKNGGEERKISGRVIADETSFVIFDRELAQNYGFGYVPRGKNLDLTFEGNTIEMKAQ